MIRSDMTIHEACLEASSLLEAAGVLEARHNAELLLSHLFGWNRAQLLLRWREPFPSELQGRWEQLVMRKASGEPVQYMIGEQEFYGLPFRVTPAVLIPRPETELLVEAVIAAGRRIWPRLGELDEGDEDGKLESMSYGCKQGGDELASDCDKLLRGRKDPSSEGDERVTRSRLPVMLDAGTGSGAIATAIAAQCADWTILASDMSEAALEVARDNARRNGVQARIEWVQGDWLAPFLPGGQLDDRRIDIFVSNPPYIPSRDIEALQPEVRDFEPRGALDGGADGLEPYRRLIAQLAQLATRPQLVAFEVGIGQAPQVADWLRAAGWSEASIIRDYSGIERHVLAECKPCDIVEES